jgi:hypothetical protein
MRQAVRSGRLRRSALASSSGLVFEFIRKIRLFRAQACHIGGAMA